MFFWKISAWCHGGPLDVDVWRVVVVVIGSLLPEGVLAEESLRGGGYLRGLQVWQNNPLGVGVDGFQDSYLVRRAGDAEEVRPFRLVADWLVILGVFALPDVGFGSNHSLLGRPPASGFLAGLSAALASALLCRLSCSCRTSALLRVLGVLKALVAWHGVWPPVPHPWAEGCTAAR